MPDEWQARQAIPAILHLSDSKHNANKNTRVRGPFHQLITVCVCVCVCVCTRLYTCVLMNSCRSHMYMHCGTFFMAEWQFIEVQNLVRLFCNCGAI